MAVCIFCGASGKLTEEHLLPRWAMAEVMSTKPQPSGEGTIIKGVHTIWQSPDGDASDTARAQWAVPSVEFKVGGKVCAACNGGWMSAVEVSARPALTKMIHDHSIDLSSDECAAVANWLALKTIITMYGHPAFPAFDGEWAAQLYDARPYPPPPWSIRCGRFEGATAVFFGASPVSFRADDPLTGQSGDRPAFVGSIVIGRFFGQVIGVQAAGSGIQLSPDFLVPLWPSSLLGLDPAISAAVTPTTWPPPRSVDDQQLRLSVTSPAAPSEATA